MPPAWQDRDDTACRQMMKVETVTLGVRYFLCKRQLWVKGCLT